MLHTITPTFVFLVNFDFFQKGGGLLYVLDYYFFKVCCIYHQKDIKEKIFLTQINLFSVKNTLS